jgi:hypothetical protein
MEIKGVKPKSSIDSVGQVGSAGDQKVGRAQQAVVPPLQTPDHAQLSSDEQFIGQKLAMQFRRIPQFKGQTPSNAAYKKILDPTGQDKRHSFSIFFEAESKQTFTDHADVEALGAAQIRALTEGLSALFPADKVAHLKGWTVKADKPDLKQGAHYHDYYWDDEKGSLAKQNAALRERVIEGSIGKYESKTPGDQIQGSSVMGRNEFNHSLKTHTTADIIEAAKAGEIDNPVTALIREVPGFDLSTLRRRIEVSDLRQQYILVDDKGKEMFLLTLDQVTAADLDTKKEGHFHEVEIERMDGSTKPVDLRELIDLSNLLAEKFHLVPSPGTKYQRGRMVTE